MNKYFLVFIILLLTVPVFSQNETTTISDNIQIDFFYGKLIEHDKKLKNAIQGNPFGFIVSWNYKNTSPTKFNTAYNYPERGYSFLYENFNSTILGEVYGGYRHFSYNLILNKKNKLKLATAFGIGYATKKYNKITNNQNYAIGSHLLASAYLKLQYLKLFKKNNISINSSLSLIHFSNIGFKNPNLGINTVALNIGVKYDIDNTKRVSIEKEVAKNKIDSKIAYNVLLRSGFNESLVIDSGLFPFYTFTFYGSKELNNYSTITGGIDFFDSKFLKEHIKYINENEGRNYNKNDYYRAGIFIGHELTQNNFAFVSQLGYTFYSQYPYVSDIYERFGLKYKLSEHFFSELTMKVNLFRAESLEFGLGYKF